MNKLKSADNRGFFPLKFEMPSGARRIEIKFTYWPQYTEDNQSAKEMVEAEIDNYFNRFVSKLDSEIQELYKKRSRDYIDKLLPLKNHLNFSIYDSRKRFRGRWDSPHHYGKRVVINSKKNDPTSTGFIPGLFSPGNWTIEIETHGINSQEVSYKLELWIYKELREEKWYRGELHLHTHHSDGKASLKGLVKAAIDNNIDFFALTDHNTISGWSELVDVDFTIIPGMELSTFYGHAVALGIQTYIDWRTKTTNDLLEDKIAAVHGQGGLFSIAHPFNIGDPLCMGCQWQYQEIPWDEIDLLEIWSKPWQDNLIKNTLALQLWNQKLSEGKKVVGLGVNDLHDPDDYYKGIPYPLTYVKIEELNVEHILDALIRGKVYISSGPEIDFIIESGDKKFRGEIGDTLSPGNVGWQSVLKVRELEEKAAAVLYRNGEEIFKDVIARGSKFEIRHLISPVANDFYYWTIEAVDTHEKLVITNPIFFKERVD